MHADTARAWGLDATDQMVLLWGDGWTSPEISRLFGVPKSHAEYRIQARLSHMEHDVTSPKVRKWIRKASHANAVT